jgi:hypothetical protein
MPLIKIWRMDSDNKGNREILFRTDIDTYVCPVDSNSNRTDLNYIFDIPLKLLSMKAKHWVLRGVCLTTIWVNKWIDVLTIVLGIAQSRYVKWFRPRFIARFELVSSNV